MRRWPICQDRSCGNDRCRKGSAHRNVAQSSYTRGIGDLKLSCGPYLNDASDQIVVVCFSDLAAIETTCRERIPPSEVIDEQLSVYLRGMHGGTSFPKQIGFLGGTFREQVELTTDELLLLFAANALLHSH